MGENAPGVTPGAPADAPTDDPNAGPIDDPADGDDPSIGDRIDPEFAICEKIFELGRISGLVRLLFTDETSPGLVRTDDVFGPAMNGNRESISV